MMKYFSERKLNSFIRKYEVSGEWGFILKLWDEGELNFQMPFRDLTSVKDPIIGIYNLGKQSDA